MKYFFSIFITSTLLFISCYTKLPTNSSSGNQTVSKDKVTAENISFNNYIKTNVLSQCTGCHGGSGGVSYDGTYADLIKKISHFNEEIQKESMPQGSPLPQSERILIQAWVNKGAPEN